MTFYTYVIHFEDLFYYIGKRKCPEKYNPWNDPYKGSPKTHKNKWNTTNFVKVVIECFDNDKDVSQAEADLLEQLDWKNDPYCLNECCGGKFSYEANRRGALIRNKLKVKDKTRIKISKMNKERWDNMDRTIRKKLISKLKANVDKALEAARTPEAIEKKKKKLKEIKHQQGEKNSQYETVWIYNLDLRENKKIKKYEPVPDGWNIGRIVNFNLYFEKQRKKQEKILLNEEKRKNIKNEKIKFYEEWYGIYKDTDFKTFCQITGYSKSQQNLCAKFKEFVKDYSPKVKTKISDK